MQKQLLLASAIIISLSAFSQVNPVMTRPAGKTNTAEKSAGNFVLEDLNKQSTKAKDKANPVNNLYTPANEPEQAANTPPSFIAWNILSGASSAYGMLSNNSKPLQYNPNVNAVSFIHRKSATYIETPAVPSSAKSGVLVAEISSNWGTTWDSTCIWSDPNTYGRYPQGAIYSPAGNTNIANAYMVGSAVAVAGLSYAGAIYASKPIGVAGSTVFNSTADATPNAMQFMSSSSPTYAPNLCKHSWPRYGFSSTDDGIVRSLALIKKDEGSPPRGYAIVKGSFNAGIFNWTTDSLTPPAIVTTGGTKVLSSDCQMAWNRAGTIGYVVMTGALNTASLSNKGYQPIIYKTTNSGASWAMVTGIDFNAVTPEIKQITDHLAGVPFGLDTVGVPYFGNWDIAVDSTNKLHIGGTIMSAYSSHNDSLGYTSEFTISINPGSYYAWKHTPGYRPFLYDFIGDGSSAWNVKIVDSLSTEDPGDSPSGAGFNVNPWDNGGMGGFKINVDERVQLGRTPDGNFITFSWSESDTNFIANSQKYNGLPNIKTRCMRVGGANAYNISPTEINVSKPAIGQGTINPNIASRSTLHYMSPTTGTAAVLSAPNSFTVDINTPFTVTNSNPFSQVTNNTTWYTTAKLSYSFPGMVNIDENLLNNSGSILFPNPAQNNATLLLDLKNNSDVTINIYNLVGQLVKTMKAQGQAGENNINIDLNNLSAGVYMVNLKAGNANSTKKLVIQ